MNVATHDRRRRSGPMQARGAWPRAGYTLMEMLCVLAIVVIIASISVPVISTTLTDSRIVASADIVRARLADTRSRALDEGRPWKLACLPGTGTYQLAPENSPVWETAGSEPEETPEYLRDELPPGIVFAMDAGAIFSGSGGGGSSGGWETMAVYLANGSAREDRTFFLGKNGIAPLGVQLRAITGTATIQDYLSMQAEEGMP